MRFPARRARRTAALALAAAVAATGLLAAPEPAAAAEPAAVVRAFGFASPLGAPAGPLRAPVVAIAAHPRAHGYWLLGQDGGVFTYGRARFYGSTGATTLNQPVVGIEPTRSGRGYWLVAGDGGVFTFGRARFHGSTGAMTLARPIVGMASTRRGRGYWLVGEDGGVFTFGNARFFGSAASLNVGVPFVGIASTPSGRGYVLATADGRLFSFGDARPFPSRPLALAAPVTDIELTRSGRGVWLAGADGGVFTFGNARYLGAATGTSMVSVGLARTPEGVGYWIPLSNSGPAVPPNSGVGRRVVYANGAQRVWLVESSGIVAHSWLVSGRRGVPSPGTYAVFSKSPMSSARGGSLRLPYMTRFAHGRTLDIGFHGIPLRGDGSPIQSDSELGQFRSAGCVRMNQDAARTLYEWAPIGTPVVVLP